MRIELMTPGLQDQCSPTELWRLWNLGHLNQCSAIVTVLVWLRANLDNYLKMKLIAFSGAMQKQDGMCSWNYLIWYLFLKYDFSYTKLLHDTINTINNLNKGVEVAEVSLKKWIVSEKPDGKIALLTDYDQNGPSLFKKSSSVGFTHLP